MLHTNEFTNCFEDVLNPKMSPIEKKSVQLFIDGLIERNCKYLIIDPDGDEYTNIETLKIRRERKQVFKHYVNPFLDQLTIPGKFVYVPFGEYSGSDLQANICARALTRWGHSSVTTSVNKENQYVEVLRVK
jgi:hypothetical protein